jgi:methylglyoxal synthase
VQIALIAHDDKKEDLIEFAQGHADSLAGAELIATGTTGQRLNDETDLEVERMESGPLGGDMMIGAEVARENCDAVFFLRDPLRAQAHEPDITALLRICDVHDIPLATNLTSAHAILDSLAD